jgi:cysteine desulfurase
MGLTHELALGALRLSLGRQTTAAEIDRVLEILPGIIQNIRQLNPAYELAA